MLDFKQIITLVQLEQTKSYSLAGDQVEMTESQARQTITDLEQELGVQLVQATPTGVDLTAAGRAILPLAKEIAQGVERLQATVTAYQEKAAAQTVKFTVVPGFANYKAAAVVEQVGQNQHLAVTEDDDPLAELRAQAADIAFISYDGNAEDSSDVDLLPVGQDKLAVYVPARNSISQQPSLSLQDLIPEKFLGLKPDLPLAKFIQQVCEDAGAYYFTVFEGSKAQTLVNMVALGMGVTLLLEQSIAEPLDQKVVKIPLVPAVTQDLAFARLKGVSRTPEQEQVWQDLVASFKN